MLRTFCVLFFCITLATAASSDKKIDAAKEKYEAAVEKANEIFAKAMDKAKSGLQKVYKKAIETHRKKGDKEAAEALNSEFVALTTEKVPEPPEQTKQAKASQSSGNKKLIAAIGAASVNKDKETVVTAAALGDKKHVFLYFSAHWCPPCRMFTPKLVEFYKNNGGGKDFEIVFVSSDRDEAAMYGYMSEVGMQWISVPFSKVGASGLKTTYGGRGIPNLVLLDNKGNVLSGSYQDGQYVGPSRAMEDYPKFK